MNEIKLVCIPTLFYWIKLHLSKCSGSWVVSIKLKKKVLAEKSKTCILIKELLYTEPKSETYYTTAIKLLK
jgi:hypothetical protein